MPDGHTASHRASVGFQREDFFLGHPWGISWTGQTLSSLQRDTVAFPTMCLMTGTPNPNLALSGLQPATATTSPCHVQRPTGTSWQWPLLKIDSLPPGTGEPQEATQTTSPGHSAASSKLGTEEPPRVPALAASIINHDEKGSGVNSGICTLCT